MSMLAVPLLIWSRRVGGVLPRARDMALIAFCWATVASGCSEPSGRLTEALAGTEAGCGSRSARLAATSSSDAIFLVSAASEATMARPHALDSAFCTSDPAVYGVFPGKVSHAF